MTDIIIYALVHEGAGIAYVGATCNYEARKSSHMVALRSKKHGNAYLQEAFDSFQDGWTFEVLETCPAGDSILRENFHIDSFRRTHTCVNMLRATTSPMRNRKLSDEWKAKISAGCRGKKGRVLTPEQSAMMFAHRKPMTDENKAIAAKVCRARAKPIKNLTTGEIFRSASHAAKQLGVHATSLREACRGKLATVKGHQWAYLP